MLSLNMFSIYSTLTNIFKHIDLQTLIVLTIFHSRYCRFMKKKRRLGTSKTLVPHPLRLYDYTSSLQMTQGQITKCIHGKKVLAIKHNQTKNVHLDLKMLEEIGRQHEKSSIYSIWDYCTCSLINDSARLLPSPYVRLT